MIYTVEVGDLSVFDTSGMDLISTATYLKPPTTVQIMQDLYPAVMDEWQSLVIHVSVDRRPTEDSRW
jgi:hypothetical protein